MLVYPEYPLPNTPIKCITIHDILKSEISFGFTYKRRRSFRRKRQFILSYSWLKPNEVEILQNFYNEVQESDGYFYYISHTKYSWKNEYVAKVIDTSVIQYELPLYKWEELIIYVNGVEVYDYEIINSYPRAVVKFNSSLNLGDLITCSFKNANVCLICEFDENSMGLEHLVAGYSNIGDLKINEVLNY